MEGFFLRKPQSIIFVHDLYAKSVEKHTFKICKYLLLTEFEGRTVSYGPSFFLLDLWPKREARGP